MSGCDRRPFQVWPWERLRSATLPGVAMGAAAIGELQPMPGRPYPGPGDHAERFAAAGDLAGMGGRAAGVGAAVLQRIA